MEINQMFAIMHRPVLVNITYQLVSGHSFIIHCIAYFGASIAFCLTSFHHINGLNARKLPPAIKNSCIFI